MPCPILSCLARSLAPALAIALVTVGCANPLAAPATLPQPGAAAAPIQAMTREQAAQLSAEAERALGAGHVIDAGRAWVRIVTMFPDDARAWFRLGTVYLRTGQYGAAQMACERALRLEPGMAKAQANLALAHLHQFRAAAVQAGASAAVPEANRRTLTSLMRDVDHALGTGSFAVTAPARTAAAEAPR